MTDKLRIAVIDDDADWRQTIKMMVSALGYTAEHTAKEEELIAMLKDAAATGRPYDVVTIDMNFRIGSTDIEFRQGQQILKRIKTEFPDLPCIMISGSDIIAHEILMMRDDYGLDFFISKDDLGIESFETAVRRVMERRVKLIAQPVKAAEVAAVAGTKVFISYRRQNSWGAARAITNSLRQIGVEVFFDVDSIDQGRFERFILKAIADCDYFLVLLAPATLSSQWVIEEIKFAMKLGKKIIPIFLDDFQFDDTIPDAIQNLSEHNAVVIRYDFYDAAIERLMKRFMNL